MLQMHQDRNREMQCPFDPAHLIRPFKLASHIRKCFRSYPHIKKIRCPFDATHIIDPVKFQHHLDNCESSGNVWNSIYTTTPDNQVGTIPLEEACANEPRYLNEDWEGGHTTYDPMKVTENKEVIRLAQCVPKSERKTFKLMERRRMAALEKQNNHFAVPKEVKKEETDAPLRRPNIIPRAISRNSSLTKDSSCNLLNNSLDSYFAKPVSVDKRVEDDKENKKMYKDLKNMSLGEQAFANANKIDFAKPTVSRHASESTIEKQADTSCSSIISKHLVGDKVTESLEKSLSKKKDESSTQVNNSCKFETSQRRVVASSSDDSSSDSDSSDSMCESFSSKPRASGLPRMPKITYEPSVGRGLTLLFKKQKDTAKLQTMEPNSETENTTVDYEKYGYED